MSALHTQRAWCWNCGFNAAIKPGAVGEQHQCPDCDTLGDTAYLEFGWDFPDDFIEDEPLKAYDPPSKTLRIFADPCLFDGSTWGHVATIEELTEVITRALTEKVIRQSETLNIRFRYLTDEEVEDLTSI